jgi:hypothetical protein
VSSPITIRGRQYQWEVHDEKLPGEGPTYVITGKRGHKWWTCRNKPNPDLMFLLPDKGFSKTMDRVWLTDSTGNLEVYSE